MGLLRSRVLSLAAALIMVAGSVLSIAPQGVRAAGPTSPTGVTASVTGPDSVTVTWSAPTQGTEGITGYTATADHGSESCSTTAYSCTISGLTAGQTYLFMVVATYPGGPGSPSEWSSPVTLQIVSTSPEPSATASGSAPGAPGDVSAEPGDGRATVSWAAADSNGDAITSYTAASEPEGKSCQTASLSCEVEGLTNGMTYTFTVTATNHAGTGPASDPSSEVVPSAASISGLITGPGSAPLPGITVSACSSADAWDCHQTHTRSDGIYEITGLPERSTRVYFQDPNGTYAAGFWDGTGFTADLASSQAFALGGSVTGLNAELPLGVNLSGTVSSSSGGGAAGLTVTACRGSATTQCPQAVTASDGTYTIHGLTAGSYVVAFNDHLARNPHATFGSDAYGGGYYSTTGLAETRAAATVLPVASTPITGIDGTLPAYHSISGTVTDNAGHSIEMIHVSACLVGTSTCYTGDTGSDGAYWLDGLPSGDYHVQFTDPIGGTHKSGFWSDAGLVATEASASAVPLGSSDATGIDVQLPPAGTPGPTYSISGTLTGPGGADLTGTVRVFACTQPDPNFSNDCPSTTTTGAFELSSLAPGSYILVFVSGDYRYAWGYYVPWVPGHFVTRLADAAPVLIDSADVSGLTATLSAAHSISGTIKDLSGTAIAGAKVQACSTLDFYCYPPGVEQVTGADGTYTIPGLPSGWYDLAVSAPGYVSGYWSDSGWVFDQSSAAPIDVADSDVTGRDLQLPPAHTLSGTVSDKEGHAISGMLAEACLVAAPWGCFRSATGADGRYTLTGLPAGGYNVSFNVDEKDPDLRYLGGLWSSAGWVANPIPASLITVSDSNVTGIDIQLPPAFSISGTVTDQAGHPLAGINVGSWCQCGGRPKSMTTDADGVYMLSGWGPGTYLLAASDDAGAYVAGTYASATITSSDTTGVDIRMFAAGTTAGTVSGRITDAHGAPAVGVWVYEADDPSIAALTDSSGNYSMSGLTPGMHFLKIQDDNYLHAYGFYASSGFATFRADATPVMVGPAGVTGVNVTIPDGYAIRGTIRGPSGTGLWRVNVSYCDLATQQCEWAGNENPDGTYVLPLAPGSYRLFFSDCRDPAHFGAGYYSASGYVEYFDAATTITLASADATGIDITLPRVGLMPPDAPEKVTATAGNASAAVSWSDPLDDGGSPISGYTVTSNPDGRTCTTTGDQSCTIEGLTNGTAYTFTVTATNVLGTGPASDPSNQATPHVTYSIGGTVTDLGGNPVSGIDVNAWCMATDFWCDGGATSGDDGTFVITGLDAGYYKLGTTDRNGSHADGFYLEGSGFTMDRDNSTAIYVGGNVTGVSIRLPAGYTVSGNLTAAGGAPIKGIRIYARSVSQGFWIDTRGVETGSDGSYTVRGLPADSYVIQFGPADQPYATGFYTTSGFTLDEAAASPVVVPPNATGIDAELPPTYAISGTVTNKLGQPLSGVQVSSCSTAGCYYARTQTDGSYSLSGLLPGSYPLAVNLDEKDPARDYQGGYWSESGLVADSGSATPIVVPPGTKGIDIQLPDGSTIGGAVSDKNGQALPGILVSVCLAGSQTSCRNTGTDGDGNYLVSGLAPGSYVVSFNADEKDPDPAYQTGYWSDSGFVSDRGSASLVLVPPSHTDIDVQLPPTYTISGTITGIDGPPVANASVLAFRHDTWQQQGYAVTASDGTYTLTGLAPGSYDILVNHGQDNGYAEGYWSATGYQRFQVHSSPVTVSENTSGKDLVLPLGYSISGKVTAPGGVPLAGLGVQAEPIDGSFDWLGWAPTTADGTYTMLGLPAGTYKVYFFDNSNTWATGYYSTTIADAEAWDEASELTIGPSRTGIDREMVLASQHRTIFGTVRDAQGNPLAGVLVGACPAPYTGFHGGCRDSQAVTDAQGNYALRRLPSGSYVVQFDGAPTHPYGFWGNNGGYVRDRDNEGFVDLSSGNAYGINVSLPDLRSISGRITGPDGSPVAGVEVQVCLSTWWGDCDGTGSPTGPDGTYTMSGLGSNTSYFVMTSPIAGYGQGFWSTSGFTTDFNVRSDIPIGDSDVTGIDLQLPYGQNISGRVTNTAGEPLSGIDVSATGYGVWAWAQTATDGTYTLVGVAPGDHILSFSDWQGTYAGGYWSSTGYTALLAHATPVTVASADITGRDISLPVGRAIQGTLTGQGGTSTNGIQISVCRDVDRNDCVGWTNVEPDGTYRIGGLAPGDYYLHLDPHTPATASGYYSSSTGVTADANAAGLVTVGEADVTLDFEVPIGHTIGGTVTSGGQPIAGMDVQLRCTSGGCGGGVETAGDGTYTITNLPPGEYQVSFYDSTNTHLFGWYGSGGWTADGNQAITLAIPPDATAIDVDIPLAPPTHSISGTITGANKSPLEGVSIWACRTDWANCYSATTGSDGKYRIDGVATNSEYMVFEGGTDVFASGTYSKDGYVQIWQDATLIDLSHGDATGIDIEAPWGHHVGGHVTDRSGAPLSDIAVDAYCNGDTRSWRTSVTQSDGAFDMPSLSPAACILEVSDVNSSGVHVTGYFDDDAPGNFTTDRSLATQLPASSDSLDLTIAVPLFGLPGAPTGVTATPDDGQATVTWIAATPNGSAIDHYTVTSSPGGFSCTATAGLSCTVSGLVNDTSYTFTVVATNATGDGPASDQSAAVTPVGPAVSFAVTGMGSWNEAGTPQNVTVTARDSGGFTAAGYRGTVHFTSSDRAATLPADYTFTAEDAGVHTFSSGVILATRGYRAVFVADTADGTILGSQTVGVANAAPHTMTLTGPADPYTAGPGTVTVTVLDAYGNRVVDYAGMVQFASSDPIAGLPTDFVFGPSDQGQHVFDVTLKTAGAQSLTATDNSVPALSATANVTVVPAAATTLVVSGLPASLVAGTPSSLTVTARDGYGNVATGYRGTIHFGSSDSRATLPTDYTFVAGDAGVRTFTSATLVGAGSQTITATDTSAASVTGSKSTTVTPAAPASLAFSGLPNPYPAGPGTITLSALDAYGNVVPSYRGTVHFTTTDTAGTVPANYSFTSSDAGTHSFSVTLRTFGTRTVTATDTSAGSLTVAATVTVVAGPAATFVVTGIPASVVAGTPASVTVTARDQYGNVAAGYRGTVHFTSTDTNAGLPADYAFTDGDAGVHAFTAGVVLKTTGLRSVTASDASTPSITGSQSGINVSPAAASRLVVSAIASPVVAGTAGGATVTAQDAYGNVATGYRGTIHFTSSDTAAALPANYLFTATDAGRHVFSTGVTLKTAGSQTVTATDTVTATIAGSQSVTVNPAAPKTLVLSGLANPFVAGSSGWITVTARDSFGNIASGYLGTVHFTSTDAAAVLPANYPFVPSDGGVHTFPITLKTAGPKSVTVTDTVTTTMTATSTVTVSPSSGVGLVMSSLPASVTAGSAASATVTIRDAYGNTATGYRGTIHFTATDPLAVLPADYTFSATDNGVHAFTNGVTLKTAGGRSVTATDASAAPITGSQSVTVNPAAAKTLVVSGLPNPSTAGTPGTATVTALDAYGNIATGYRGTVHFTSTDTAAVLPANYAFTATDAGIHTFNVTLKTAGSRTVTATDTVTATITGSQTVTVAPVAAAQLSVTGIASPIVAGTPGTVTVTARDAYGNVALGYTGTVHFTSTDTQAVLPLDYTFVEGDLGAHTFPAGVSLKTSGSMSVTATDSLTASIAGSQTVTVNPAGAASLVVSGLANPFAAGASSVTVSARDAFGNVAPSYRGRIHFTSTDTAGTVPADYTFTATDAGNHTFASGLTFKTVGSQSITATDTVAASITGSQSTIVVGAAAKTLAMAGVPSSTTAGNLITVTVTLRDTYGNVATGYRGTVRFSSTDPAAVLPSNYTFTAADAGVHTFRLLLTTAGSRSVTVVDTVTTTLTASATSAVAAAPADSYVIGALPASTTAGTAATATITVRDAYGNTATGYRGTIHFTSIDGSAVLPADYTFTATDNGSHSFASGVTLKTAGVQTLTATDTGDGSVTASASVTVNAGAAKTLTLISLVNPATAGTVATVTVTARDAYGNLVTGYRGKIHFTATDPAAVLPSDYTFTATDAGGHVFRLIFETPGSTTLRAADTVTATIAGSVTVIVN